MLSLYEGEKQRPQLDTLEKLLDALGVRLGELAARLVPGVNYFCAQF
jgi:transcriptional regulator with XRE-family HTH domain